MTYSIRCGLLLAASLATLSACQRASADNFDNGPVTVLGEWRLAVSGGGITGVMTPVPASSDFRSVFGPDSAYAEYTNGRLTTTSTFQLRSQASYPGGPMQAVLAIKSYNSPSGQPYYRLEYIMRLTGGELWLTTGSGCAINSNYVRVKTVDAITH